MNKIEMQGDVALRSATKIKIEKNAHPVKDKVLAWGEISGHAHVVTGDAEVYQIGDKMVVVVGSDGAKLEHMKFATKAKADHAPILLAPNTQYEVLLQNEYNPWAEEMQRVLD